MMKNDVSARASQELTIRQLKFIEAMLAGNSIKTSAKVAGIAERTAHNWLLLNRVKVALDTGTEALVSSARERIELLSLDAIDTLASIMNDPEAPYSVRATCARSLAAKRLEIIAPSERNTERPRLDYSSLDDSELDIITGIFEQAEKRRIEGQV